MIEYIKKQEKIYLLVLLYNKPYLYSVSFKSLAKCINIYCLKDGSYATLGFPVRMYSCKLRVYAVLERQKWKMGLGAPNNPQIAPQGYGQCTNQT